MRFALSASYVLVLGCFLGCKHSSPDSRQSSLGGEAVRRQKACNAGDVKACGELGTMYEAGLEVAKDPVKAAAL